MVFGSAAERVGSGGDDGNTSTEALNGAAGENRLRSVVLLARVLQPVESAILVNRWALIQREAVPELIVTECALLVILERELNFRLIEPERLQHQVCVDVAVDSFIRIAEMEANEADENEFWVIVSESLQPWTQISFLHLLFDFS